MRKKHIQIEIGEKLSEELLCDVCIPLTEIYLSSPRGFRNSFWRKRYQETFGSIGMAMVKEEISSDKTGKKISVKLLCVRYICSSHIVKTFLILYSLETPSCMDTEGTFRSTFRPMVKEEISSDENWIEAF